MTISAALAEARRRLAGHSATPELDAEVLLAHVLNGTRSSLITASRDSLDSQSAQRFDQLLQRRKQGEPIAYLTGEKEFWSLKLKVTPDVLAPRPETELLVEWVLNIMDSSFPRRRESNCRIADLGTGSGAIALALAKELPRAKVLATDISSKALALAEGNARTLAISNVEFHPADWLETLDARLRGHDENFELILSNPPYIAENDPHLASLGFEPTLALTAGPDGLSALRQITADAGKFLKPGGWLLLEHGAEQGAAVRELFRLAGFKNIATRRDLAGHERATAGQSA